MHQVNDTVFEFLNLMYARAVADFLDDPDGACGPDAKAIAEEYHHLKLVGLGIGKDFWKVGEEEGRTDNEVQRLKDFIKEANRQE